MSEKKRSPIADNIRKYRQKAGISQDRLSKRANVAFHTITKIEAGSTPNPTITTVKKIADALGVSIDNLMKVTILACLIFLQSATLADLTSIGAPPMNFYGGARYLGMGGAACSLAYNADAIFSNPGALAWSKGVFLNFRDMNNVAAGQSYPTGTGQTISIGFYKSGAFGIPSQTSTNEYSVSDNAIILSAGARLSSLPYFTDYEWSKNFGVGMNLKVLTGLTLGETGLPDRTTRGMDADIGVLYYDRKWLAAGMNLVNILPSPLGEMTWNDNQKEGIPKIIRIGGAAVVAGEKDSPILWEGNQLILSADMEIRDVSLLHAGAEWSQARDFSFRCGVSQNQRQGKVESDPAFGVGWRFSDWAAEAAYSVEPVKGGSVLTLSLTYFPENWFFLAQPIDSISLTETPETIYSSIEVSGKVKPEVKLKINGVSMETDAEGNFSKNFLLTVGNNLFSVETDFEGEKQTKPYYVMRKTPPLLPAERITIYDDQTVFDDKIEVAGKLPEGVSEVYVNGKKAFVDIYGNFRTTIPLKMGENLITVEGIYGDQVITKTYSITRQPPPKVVEEKEEPEVAVKKVAKKPTRVARRRPRARRAARPRPKAVKKPAPPAPAGRVLTEKVSASPRLIKFVRRHPDKFSYDRKTNTIKIRGTLTEAEKKELLAVVTDPRDRAAIERLIALSEARPAEKAIPPLQAGMSPPPPPTALTEPGYQAKYAMTAEEIYQQLKETREREANIAKFTRLQGIIAETTGLTITKKADIKVPPGYLCVYVTTKDTYVALKHEGGGKVSVDHYRASNGKWTHVAYVPYNLIKNLI